MAEYMSMWQNYFNFHDRTSVRGYWMAFLFNFIAAFVIGTLGGMLHLQILYSIYTLAALIPGLALCIRRLHDAGKPWGWIFITLIPVAGFIIMLVFLCSHSVETNDGSVQVI